MPSKHKNSKSQRLTMPKKSTRKFGAALARSKSTQQRTVSNGGGRTGTTYCMTTEELCRYDDICTGLIIDPYMGFQTHKMNIRFRPLSNQEELKRIVEEFIRDQDYENAHDKLLAVDPRRVGPLLKSEREQCLMRQHIYCFLKMFDKDAGFVIQPCQRYTLEDMQGGKLVATKAWKKGQVISMLVGCVGELTPDQEKELLVWGQNDYSVQYSDRKKKSQLWLGPAAYMNHDCRPNCSFHPVSCSGAARLQVIRDISAGDEIVLSYGDGFFTDEFGNSCCECSTCEQQQRGAFRPKEDAVVEETRERLRQVPSRMSTRAERSLEYSCDNWTSRAHRLEASAALLKSGDLKKRKMTRYDAELIIEGNRCLPELSPRKVTSTAPQPPTPLSPLPRSRHNSSHSRPAADQSNACIDLQSNLNSTSNLSASSAARPPGETACSPSNPCVPRQRGKRALSLVARKSNPKHARLSGLMDTGDENQPIIDEELFPECGEDGDSPAALWSAKVPDVSGFDLATGSTTVRGVPLSSRKNSVHAHTHGTFSHPPNGHLTGHMIKIRAVKGEPVRQSPRLRPRSGSALLPSDSGDNDEVLDRVYENGVVEFGDHHPSLDNEMDNDDSGLGEMIGDPYDKSLDSNHNFHDPPVLEPQMPFIPCTNAHTSFTSLAHVEEDSDQELNKSSSSVPQLTCEPVVSFNKTNSPSQKSIPEIELPKRKQRPTMKLRIKLEHPDQHKLHDFNQQLERDGRSQFVQIEPKETRAVKLANQMSCESPQSPRLVLESIRHVAEPDRHIAEQTRFATEPTRPLAESLKPPVRLRLRSDKSGTVFQCLSPKPATCLS